MYDGIEYDGVGAEYDGAVEYDGAACAEYEGAAGAEYEGAAGAEYDGAAGGARGATGGARGTKGGAGGAGGGPPNARSLSNLLTIDLRSYSGPLLCLISAISSGDNNRPP